MNTRRDDHALLFDLMPVNDVQLAVLHSGALEMDELHRLAFQILVSGQNIFHNQIENLLDQMASRWCAPSNFQTVIRAVEDLVEFYEPMMADALRSGGHSVEHVKVYEQENAIGVWVISITN